METLEKLKGIDLELYDGIYLGDPTCIDYPSNLSVNLEDLRVAVGVLKEKGVRAFVSTHAVPRNRDLDRIKPVIEAVLELPIDGIEVHNMGLLRYISRVLGSDVPIHVGFFANVYTHETVRVLERFNAVRVFLNPELSLEEIQFINESTDAEIPVFAHGKVPLGISETCFIKEYNPRVCEDVCSGMWLASGKWRLKSIGYATLSGKDWSVLEYLGTLFYRGFSVFHIQGLREGPEYLNSIASIYRGALEKILEGVNDYIEEEWIAELSRLCPQGLCNGYLFRRAGHRYIGRFFGGERMHEAERRERHETR